MSDIITLSESVIAKIAAGEVIFRPQSVIKELVENAIDAEAQRIKIQLKDGGKTMISVFDDGVGMDRADLLCCYLRHTTSKIKTSEDLDMISTLGFRGEALASIAAVSKLKIASRTKEAEIGNVIEVVAGKLKMSSEVGMDYGTEVWVSDIFFNLPARKKFLRSNRWEAKLVTDIIKHYGYVYPQINFSLIIDDRMVIDLLSSDQRKRIEKLSGIGPNDLIKVKGGKHPVRIKGYLSNPTTPQKGESLIYVNQRPINDRRINSIIRDHYPNRHPFYLLFLDVESDFVDVNVHPTKSEVKFHDRRYLNDLLQSVIKDGISEERTSQQQVMMEVGSELEKPKQLFQIHKSYILAEVQSGIIIIDQHAAHERIIYEQVLNQKQKGQPLLFPISVELDEDQYRAFKKNQEHLLTSGISTREFGPRTVIVETIPSFTSVSAQNIIAIFDDLTNVVGKREDIAKIIACHAAIKAKTAMTEEEMLRLIDLLFGCQNPYFCPHGRPTIFRMEVEDLERRFGRR